MEIMKKILIYGGSGYLGSALEKQISQNSFIYSISRKKNLLKKNKYKYKNIKYLNDELDKRKIEKVIGEVDLLIFANGPNAEICKKKKIFFDYIKYFNQEIVKIKKIKKKNSKIIYLSSIHVYSNTSKRKSGAEDLLLSNNHYGIKNILCENILLNNFINNKKNIQIIRLANIFGIKKNTNLSKKNSMFDIALNNFCFNVLQKKKIKIKSNILEKRNYVSIDDFVNFIEYSFLIKKLPYPTIFNYASNKIVTLKKVIDLINKQSLILGIKKNFFQIKKNILKSNINYNFNLNEINKFNLLPQIKIDAEIKKTMKILVKINNG